jgi:hypothetical protein
MIRLFLQGWLYVSLQTAAVILLARNSYGAAIAVQFAINLLWSVNVRGVNARSGWAGLVYAAGAATGAATGIGLTRFV